MTVQMLRKYSNKIFIEAGCKEGGCSISAITLCGFKEVHAIELDPVYYATAVKRTAPYTNIHLYLGDSGEWLPKILAKMTDVYTIWLDAHPLVDHLDFSNTPILKECTALQQVKFQGNLPKGFKIIIDDLRCFSRADRDKIEEIARSIGTVSFESNAGVEPNDILIIN